jgi:hypothetical protein
MSFSVTSKSGPRDWLNENHEMKRRVDSVFG